MGMVINFYYVFFSYWSGVIILNLKKYTKIYKVAQNLAISRLLGKFILLFCNNICIIKKIVLS